MSSHFQSAINLSLANELKKIEFLVKVDIDGNSICEIFPALLSFEIYILCSTVK